MVLAPYYHFCDKEGVRSPTESLHQAGGSCSSSQMTLILVTDSLGLEISYSLIYVLLFVSLCPPSPPRPKLVAAKSHVLKISQFKYKPP